MKKQLLFLSKKITLILCLLMPLLVLASEAEIQKLIGEQKFAAALEKTRQSLATAKLKKDEMGWARLVVMEAQLQMSLHGYETAVKDLKKHQWPDSLLAEAMVNLTYAQSLRTYYQSYSWEIRKREKVDSKGAVDLKTWTAEQIFAEAYATYTKIWDKREKLGKYSRDKLPEILVPNTFPENIRGTLRDSLSYLFVDLLSDTSGWTPIQSNEKYLLDAKKLYAGEGQLKLKDPSIHPLKKISYLLTDLHKWHLANGKKGAALEARIELIKKVYSEFADLESRNIGMKALDAEIQNSQKEPWVTMAYAAKAELTLQQDNPDSRIKAHDLASKGAKLFPQSPGAAKCRDLIREIERPEYSIAAMNLDAQGKRSLQISYQNITDVRFRSYAYDIKAFLKNAKDYSIRPSWREIESILANQKPAYEWSTKVTPTTDFKKHQAYVIPPNHKPGFYLIMANEERTKYLTGVQVFFSDLVMSVSTNEWNKAEVEIVSGKNGDPIRDTLVTLYKADYQNGHSAVENKKTGLDGLVHFDRSGPLKSMGGSNYFLTAEKNGEIVASQNPFYIHSGNDSDPTTKDAFVYTDRSIYRPGQKILWKVVAYSGNAKTAKYATEKNTDITIYLFDGNGEVVSKKTLKTNTHGSASGDFVIPAGKLLGNWRVTSSLGGSVALKVEEYKRPTFEVEIAEKQPLMRLNQEASVTGSAKYYFGQGVSSGAAKWSVERTVVLPWWCYWGGWNWGQYQNPQIIATGSSKLQSDGSFQIKFTPKGDQRLSGEMGDLRYSYNVQVDVTDEGGETRSTTKTFTVGFTAVTATISLDDGFQMANSPFSAKILRSDLNGVPQKGKGRWKLISLKQPEATLPASEAALPSDLKKLIQKELKFPDDLKLPRWTSQLGPENLMREWAEAKSVTSGEINDESAEIALPKIPSGAYRLSYETSDAFGSRYETSKNFIVVDKNSSINLPGFFAVQKSSVEVGEKLRIYIASGFKNQRMILETFKSGKRTERKYISGHGLIEIPVTENDRGGFGMTMHLVNDHQETKFSEAVMVPWTNKQLELEFSTFRDKIRPGSKEKWAIHLKAPDKKTLLKAEELLAYMYDKSLDAFTPHRPINPMSIYPTRNGVNYPNSELGLAQIIYTNTNQYYVSPEFNYMRPDQINFYPSYGIGGPGARGGYGMARLGKSVMANEAVMMDGAMPSAAPQMVAKRKSNKADAEGGARTELSATLEERSTAASDKSSSSTPTLRTNFSETAFWQPHLKTGNDGSVKIEFDVPDSVTSWNVWVHAITNDLKYGSIKKETRTVKELMVRPYLPRFFREGDETALKVVVNNTSDKELEGELDFEILEPESKRDLSADFKLSKSDRKRRFKAPANGSTSLTYKLVVPSTPGQVAVKVVAKARDLSDGEVRPLPILPGRFHLAQSKFVTLKNKDSREITFSDLFKSDDSTRINEFLTVTIDAQLFYSVLSSMPYIINSPYKCTEQVMNSFVTTGILSSVFKKFPSVSDMAKQLSSRKTAVESFDEQDPNRKMSMEESPWLALSKGGGVEEKDLQKVLDPAIAKKVRDESLKFLEDSQTSSGGFPWFAGGAPSPYMTIYLLYGFSKAIEFGVDVPKPMIQKAWAYMHRHYIQELVGSCMSHDGCWETITFLNYVISNYPSADWTGNVFTEADKKRMLDFSFKNWKRHSPYLKGYLALTLHRAKRAQDAKLVWDSVMDSAKTGEDEGTHWAQEDRSWLWYNDTIETHAMALRTGSEVGTNDKLLDGMVQWLFLNKKLNHWKSTRATAEVIYSLTHYLSKSSQLGVKENATVKMGGQSHTFEFDPKKYTGKKNQILIPAAKISPELLPIKIEKTSPGHLFASATWHYSTEKLPDEARGDFFNVDRTYFKRVKDKAGHRLLPIDEGNKIEVGDEIEVHLSLKSKHQAEYVHLRDPRASGFEPVDFTSKHKGEFGIVWYEEIRDSGTNFFFEWLPQGEYTFKYRIRASMSGKFKTSPATVQPLYAPEFVGFSSGKVLKIE